MESIEILSQLLEGKHLSKEELYRASGILKVLECELLSRCESRKELSKELSPDDFINTIQTAKHNREVSERTESWA